MSISTETETRSAYPPSQTSGLPRNTGTPRPRRRGSSRWWLWALAGAIVLVAVGFYGYKVWDRNRQAQAGGEDRGAESQQAGNTGDKAAVRVQVVRPKRGGIARTTTQPGVVHAYDFVNLYAKVSGFLRAQVVDIGDTVEKGQTVAVVYAPELEQQVQTAAAAVERAKAGIVQAESLVAVAEADVVAARADVKESEARVAQYTASRKYREKQYVRYNELAVSRAIDERAADEKQEDFESAKAGEQVAVAGVQTSEGKLARARAGVLKAKADVKGAEAAEREAEARQSAAQIYADYTRLTSSFNGVITERHFHDGDFIRAADSGGQMPPILTIARTDLMRVVIYIPDLDVPYVDRGDAAVVRIDALGSEEFKGVVTRYSNVEMAANRSMRVEVDLPNPVGRLREGMYGNVTIQLQPPPDVLSLPSPALIQDSGHGEGSVYVARDGKAHKTTVRVGRDNGLVVEILAGLSENDRVIVSYSGSIEDGEVIEATPAEGNSGSGG